MVGHNLAAPMRVELVQLPRDLRPRHLAGRTVVVFDVLRATTTMVAALAAGAREIRVFDSLDAAATAARDFRGGASVLCGEHRCLPPPGFALGNSPGDYTAHTVGGRTVLLSTTNGTRAIVAALGATELVIAALVNATATARHVARLGRDVTLLCAGTDGMAAPEDSLGAAAVVHGLQAFGQVALDADLGNAVTQFEQASDRLADALRQTPGGRNVIAAGLAPDIEFAARLDVFDIVAGVVPGPPEPPRVVRIA